MIVLTIALAVGVNLGVYSVSKAVLLHNIGVPDEESLFRYLITSGDQKLAFSGPDYTTLKELSTFKDFFAWRSAQLRLQTSGGVEKLQGALATGNTFAILRIHPYLGRLFSENDDVSGGGPGGWAAVLGYSYWKSHFNADPAIVGKDISLNGQPVHIVGVLPPQFNGIVPLSPANLILPQHFLQILSSDEDRFAKPYYFEWIVMGRLTGATSIKTVKAHLEVIEPTFRKLADPQNLFEDSKPGTLIDVEGGDLGLRSGMKPLHSPLLIIGFLSLLIFFFCSCNLVLLLLGRSNREAHLVAIRMALGAQLNNEITFAIAESVILAAIGALLSIPIAWMTLRILSRLVQSIHGFRFFPTVAPAYGLIALATVITMFIFALVVGLSSFWNGKQHEKISLNLSRVSARSTSRSWIVGFEVFASVVLITGTILDSVGVKHLEAQPSGFGNGESVIVSLDLAQQATRPSNGSQVDHKTTTGDTKKEQFDRIVSKIAAAPGVQSVATMNVTPLADASASGSVEVHNKNGNDRQLTVWPAEVSMYYFSTIGTRIIRGRSFSDSDQGASPVCILSNQAASRLFPGDNPLDKYILGKGNSPCRVVGVAEDAHFKSMSGATDPVIYKLAQDGLPNILVKAQTSALAIAAARNAVKEVAPFALLNRIDSIETRVNDDLREWRIMMQAGLFCAIVGAVILGIGFFGILSLHVAQRRREIGVQIALGANQIQVCIGVMKKLQRPLLVGFLLGSLAAAFVGTEVARIYALGFISVVSCYLCSLIVLTCLLLLAAVFPLKRAIGVAPLECLASE